MEVLPVLVVILALSSPAWLAPSQSETANRANRDTETYSALSRAKNGDPKTVLLIHDVIDDILDRTYIYSLATRTVAFETVLRLRMTNLIPDLRKVAGLTVTSDRSVKQTWDAGAICAALSTLTDFDDESAVRLNLQRLESDPWIQATAIRNLNKLKYWQASQYSALDFFGQGISSRRVSRERRNEQEE
jgi:hypothetical protein